MATVDSNPVADRLGATVGYFMRLAGNSKVKNSIGLKMGSKLITEMLSDLGDSGMPPEIMAFYVKQLGAVTMWIATGEKDPTLPWPDDFEI